MRLFFRLAWRNILRHRRRTLIVVLAIGLGMALMMFYDGFVAGFDQAIYANAVKVLGGNIQLHAPGYEEKLDQTPLLPLQNEQAILQAAAAHPQVASASLRIKTGGLATSREGAFPVSIIGIEPERELPISLVAQNTTAGRFLNAEDRENVFIGRGLAEAMNITVGDRFTLVGKSSKRDMRQHTMTVAGIYDIGMREIEKTTVYMALGEAQYLYDLDGQATEVAIYLNKLGEESAVIRALRPYLTGYEVSSWENSFPEMKAAINSKNGVMDIFSVIILFIAGIGILNLLMMAVYERTREIGLLGALGLKPRQISALFLLEGALMGLLGLVFGILLGLTINGIIGMIGFDYSKFTGITEYTALISGRVYPTLGLNKLPLRSLTVIIISILAAYFPAREASISEPAQALHYV